MILKIIIQVFSAALVLSYASCQISYDGHVVFRCWPQNSQQIEHLTKLNDQETKNGISFWTEPNRVNSSVDILVAPKELTHFEKQLLAWKIPSQKVLSNVGEAVRRSNVGPTSAQRYESSSSLAGVESSFYNNYQPYAIFEAKIQGFAKNPLVQVQSIGRSAENRPIYLVKISTNPGANKPVIFIDALHHAREWISASTSMYIIDTLINQNSNAARKGRKNLSRARTPISRQSGVATGSDSSILNHFDVWVVPVVNPDGYEYSRTTDRMWRKTRSNSGTCMGVDPNRNYPFHWRESGASRFSCHETYAGAKPGSEVEVQHIMSTLTQNRGRIRMYISLHAYSQVILSPYGYARTYPENFNELKRVAQIAIRDIASVRGTKYDFGSAAVLMYPAAGGSDDYALGTVGIKYSYTIELPDRGKFGFLLPANEIRPVGQEIFVGISSMARAVQSVG